MKVLSVSRCLHLFLFILWAPVFPVFGEILEVSRAVYLPGQKANAQGVYPVRITWKKPDGESPAAYQVYRSDSPRGEFLKITGAPVNAAEEAGGRFTWVDTNPGAVPGKPYYYRIWSQNVQGQGSFFPEALTGYGALSPEQYFFEYNKTIKSSQKKLILMNKPGSLDKVGSETKNGSIRGLVNYACRLVRGGLGGARVTMHYDNYADFYIGGDPSQGAYFTLTGDANSSVNMAASGVMEGVINAAGMYPGKVHYDRLRIAGGAVGGGFYGVEPEGFPRTEISWKDEQGRIR